MERTVMLAKSVNILQGQEDRCGHKTKWGGRRGGAEFSVEKGNCGHSLKGGIRTSLLQVQGLDEFTAYVGIKIKVSLSPILLLDVITSNLMYLYSYLILLRCINAIIFFTAVPFFSFYQQLVSHSCQEQVALCPSSAPLPGNLHYQHFVFLIFPCTNIILFRHRCTHTYHFGGDYLQKQDYINLFCVQRFSLNTTLC